MSEPSWGAGEPRAPAPPPKFTYDYPQASPAGAILMYTQNGNVLDLITTFRSESVGTGRSVTTGGYWEVKNTLAVPDKVQDGDAELWREAHEELGEEFKTLIPYEQFHARAQYLWDGMRHLGDTQSVHSIVQKYMRISEREKDAILAMPMTEEQRGKKMESFLLGAYKDAASAEKDIRERLSDFHYPVEVDAVVRWYNKLNEAKPEFVPPGGWN